MTKNLLFMAGILSVFMLGTACKGPAIKVNPSVKEPIPVSNDSPAFLFPINLGHSGAPGNTTVLGVSVSGGIIAKYGKTVISGQQLFPLVGNLSFELAEAIKAQADGNSFKMTGSAANVASNLAAKMQMLIKKLVELKLIDKPINFKYIIAVHSHGSACMAGKMVCMDSWGGIYDVQSGEILTYIESSDKLANEEKIVMGQMPVVYNGIIEKLIKAGKK